MNNPIRNHKRSKIFDASEQIISLIFKYQEKRIRPNTEDIEIIIQDFSPDDFRLLHLRINEIKETHLGQITFDPVSDFFAKAKKDAKTLITFNTIDFYDQEFQFIANSGPQVKVIDDIIKIIESIEIEKRK